MEDINRCHITERVHFVWRGKRLSWSLLVHNVNNPVPEERPVSIILALVSVLFLIQKELWRGNVKSDQTACT